MKRLRFYLTMFATKTLIMLMRALGRNATNFPGSFALALCPDILGQLEKPKTIIAVTGTNGKTTVSNMISDVLSANGFEFTNNRFGGNVDTGITAALVDASTLLGKPKRDLAVLEIDERSANRIYPHITPDFLVCTNLARDSFKRNAHTEFIADILTKYIPPKTRLILCGDDLICSNIAPQNKERVYFGADFCSESEFQVRDSIIRDIVYCPHCSALLDYEFIRYNHIGQAKCKGCGFGSPKLDYRVTTRGNGKVTLVTPTGAQEYKLVGTNITDLYNMTAAIALLSEFSLTAEQIQPAFENMKIVETRFRHEEINGKHVYVTLAKGQNPIACSRACDFVRRQSGEKCVIMILEDLYDAKRTTENIAWIHETDFEFLCQPDIAQIIVGGKRSADYLARLLIAGVPRERIFICDKETDTVGFIDAKAEKFFILYDLFNTVSLDYITKELREMLVC